RSKRDWSSDVCSSDLYGLLRMSGKWLCLSGLCGARSARPPEDDLGGVDDVTVVIAGSQARGMAHSAGDVVDLTAGSAHDVVVVVVSEQLEAAGRAVRLDPSEDTSIGERVQDVVDRLDRHGP